MLKKRLIACFDIFPRALAMYFWPAKANKIEQDKGALLVLETLPKYFNRVAKAVKQLHGDQLPFIGSMTIDNVHTNYLKWMKGELK